MARRTQPAPALLFAWQALTGAGLVPERAWAGLLLRSALCRQVEVDSNHHKRLLTPDLFSAELQAASVLHQALLDTTIFEVGHCLSVWLCCSEVQMQLKNLMSNQVFADATCTVTLPRAQEAGGPLTQGVRRYVMAVCRPATAAAAAELSVSAACTCFRQAEPACPYCSTYAGPVKFLGSSTWAQLFFDETARMLEPSFGFVRPGAAPTSWRLTGDVTVTLKARPRCAWPKRC